MKNNKSITVSVPASSGNLGPGFDVLGLALNLRNELRVRVVSPHAGHPKISVRGEGAASVALDESNIIFRSLAHVYKKARKPIPQLELVCVNRIPLARGLGSSSAAILEGLLAGNALLGNKFSPEQILDWAAQEEGHPDNVAPALLGGVKASAMFHGHVITSAWPVPKVNFVVAIPEFELSTKKARKVVPQRVPIKDAIANLSAVALLPVAFMDQPDLLKFLLNDRWHEPFRAKLIPGFHQVKDAALGAGAYGVTLSGAGPTMLSFVSKTKVSAVGRAMQEAFSRAGVASKVLEISIDNKGALVS